MEEVFSRPGQVVVAVIFFKKTAVLNECEPSMQYSPRCVSVVMILDMDCAAEATFNNSFQKLAQMRTNELTQELSYNNFLSNIDKMIAARQQFWLKGLKTYFSSVSKLLQNCLYSVCERKAHAGGIYRLRNQGEEKYFAGVRPLYYLRRLLESRLFEKKYAAWYRESPPNSLSCWSAAVIA